MSTQVQQNSFRSLGFDDNWIGYGDGASASGAVPGIVSSPLADSFGSSYPPYPSGGLDQSQTGLTAQLMQMLQSMMGMLTQFFGGFGGFGGTGGNQTAFGNATISSTGDPHLAINGTLGDGSNVAMTYDNMQSDGNLVSSDSFWGGYQVSTQTTTPNANGITYNQSATVTTDYGQTQVSLDNAGNATILEDGSAVSIGYGQSVSLGNGETVTDNGNSLAITDMAQNGGNVTTTMTDSGNGVDVTVNAQNVDLGGDVVGNALGNTQTGPYA